MMNYYKNGLKENEDFKEMQDRINKISPIPKLNVMRGNFISDFSEKLVKFKKLSMNEIKEYTPRVVNDVDSNTNKSDCKSRNKIMIRVGSEIKFDFNDRNKIKDLNFYQRVEMYEDFHKNTVSKLSNTQKIFDNLRTKYSIKSYKNIEMKLKIRSDLIDSKIISKNE